MSAASIDEGGALFLGETTQVYHSLNIPPALVPLLKHAGAGAPSISAEAPSGRPRRTRNHKGGRGCRAFCVRFARVAERVRRRHAAARRVRTSRVVVVLVRRASSGAERLRLSGGRVRSARGRLRPVTVIGLKTRLRDLRPERGVRRGGHGVARRPEEPGAAGPASFVSR